MGKLPGFIFYPGDWLKDPELRRCSRESRSIWIDMICLMFECEERGVLSTGGRPWSLREIAGALSGDERTNLRRVGELLRNGVAKRRKDGAVFSKRLVRDDQERQQTKNRVSAHRKNRSNGTCNASVTPMYVSETVTEIPVLEITSKIEAFDAEKYVRRIQKAWIWPSVDYSPLAENEILKAFEAEVSAHNWPRIEAAHFVTERVESIAKIISAWDEDKQAFAPGLVKLMNQKAYRSPDKDWERKGAKKRAAIAPQGRPQW
jgi:hypothetical protein